MHRNANFRIPSVRADQLPKLLLIPLLCWSLNTGATTADDVVSGEKATIQQSAQSQQRINRLSDATQQAFADYQLELKRIEDLQVYNQQMEKQLQNQQSSIVNTEQSIQDVAIIERQVTPLLARMIDSLDSFIQLDLPFQLEERTERVQFLRNTLERDDVTTAEKFRQVMEAYTIEIEYGNTIEAWRGTLTLADKPREVEFLRLGRVSLVYQTLDGGEMGVWNAQAKAWQELNASYRKDVRLALKVARKQAAPELLTLPIPAPEAAQ